MLAHPQLPPGLINRCLDVLKEIMPSERDLIRVIVEIVVELREGDEDSENVDETPVSIADVCILTRILTKFICSRSTTINQTHLRVQSEKRRQAVKRIVRNYFQKSASRLI